MSRPRVPKPEQLDALRDHFRKLPPTTPKDFKVAAISAGVTPSAAMEAWSRGWPGVESIEVQLATERALAAKQAEVLRVERIVHSVKIDAVVMLNDMRQLAPVQRALIDNLVATKEDLAALPPDAAVKALQRIAKIHKDVCAVAAKAVELDRLLAGEATSIVGHKPVEPDAPVDITQAEATHAALGRAIGRAKQAATLKAAAAEGAAAAQAAGADVDGAN